MLACRNPCDVFPIPSIKGSKIGSGGIKAYTVVKDDYIRTIPIKKAPPPYKKAPPLKKYRFDLRGGFLNGRFFTIVF